MHTPMRRSPWGWRLLIVGVLAGATAWWASAEPPRKHVIVDGNRTRAVHHIPLLDEDVTQIRPDDLRAKPFSTRQTCGDCHDYDKIAMGWHFNSSQQITKAGRPGEPWVLADEATGTQLPISYRDWPGTWNPKEIGMTQWDFVKTFGHHMPGGDAGEKEEDTPNPNARWNISGRLEVNCLACHNASTEQNQSEWAIQVARENFRWAATGSSSLGIVKFMASRLPDFYDFIDGPNKDNRWAMVPEVKYQSGAFNDKDCVFFDVRAESTTNRCYYCHSSVPKNVEKEKLWGWDKDVHLAKGLGCTDCHRNGLDHSIVRGYEGERDDPNYASLTCRGCHLGDTNKNDFAFKGGRMAAPRPLHRGMPAIHLEKLSCTACHSGYLPADKTIRVRTARANRLGIHGRAQWDMDVPYIQAPVFIRNEKGVIEPREIMWPAFWGRMTGDKVTPLPLDVVTPVVAGVREADRLAKLEAERQKREAEAAKAEAEKPAEAAPAAGAPAEQAPAAEAAPAEEAKPAGAGEADEAAEAAAPEEDKTAADVETNTTEAKGEAGATEEKAEEAAPEPEPEEMQPLTEAQIVKVLTQLAASGEGQPVFVSGGKLHRLVKSTGALESMDHPSAQPYSWPFAHDVRPASESLGARGCSDCHEENSNFFFGEVKAEAPTPVGPPVVAKMHDMVGLDPTFLNVLDEGVDMRLAFIIGSVLVAVLLGAALIHYGFVGLEGLLRLLVASGSKK